MKTLREVHRGLVERSAAMALEVFTSPPKTMEEFSERLGRYNELTENIKVIREAMTGDEEELDGK